MNSSDLTLALNELTTDGLAARGFVIQTSQEGADIFYHTMKQANAIDMLDWMHEKELIDDDQRVNLTAMIESPDHENFTLALELIIQIKKSNQHGTNL